MIAVGIDVGKRNHEACFLDESGAEIGRSLHFANTAGGVRLLLERLQELPEPATIALEASGHYWLPLERRLRDHAETVQVINPLQTDAFRQVGVRKTKTDRRDAFVLADLVRIGRTRANYVPDDTILQLRELTRFRWHLVDQIGDAKRRILTVLDRVFPEFAEQFSDPFGSSARQLLDRAASAAEFAEIDLAELTVLLERVSRKRLGRDKAEALHRAASDSLGVAALSTVAQLEIGALLRQIELLEQQVAEAESAIADLMGTLDQYVTSIPGVGSVLGASILAEIGDVDRFTSPSGLVAYAGWDPGVFQTGNFQGTKQHLSKRGSPYFRRALYLATQCAHRHNPDLDAYFHKKLAEGKSYKEAIVATSRKLLTRIYAVLKQGRPFEVQAAPS